MLIGPQWPDGTLVSLFPAGNLNAKHDNQLNPTRAIKHATVAFVILTF